MPPEENLPPAPRESEAKTSKSHRPKRRWFRRLLKIFLLLLLVIAIFHRPLFHTVARTALVMVAARNNVQLDVHFSGTIFTNLAIEGIKATPTGKGPTPVEEIAIEAVRLEYSIPDLVQHGIGSFVTRYEVRNATLGFQPSGQAREAKTKKKTIIEDLNNLLGQPALYADEVVIENFNLRARGEESTVEIVDFDAFFHPEKIGHLHIGKISVPGIPKWENLNAETSYAARNLYIRGLAFTPELEIAELNFDASQQEHGEAGVILRANVFGGTFHLSLSGSELNKKGENLANAYNTKLAIKAGGIQIAPAAKYFGFPAPPVTELGALEINFSGEPERPRTWKGTVDATARGLALGPLPAESVQASVQIDGGVASIQAATLQIGRNSVVLTGAAQLPESVNEFTSTEGELKLRIFAPELAPLTALALKPPLAGSAGGEGTVTLRQHIANVDLQLKIDATGNEQMGLASGTVSVQASKNLNAQGTFAELTADAAVALNGLRYTTYNVDSITASAEVRNGIARVKTAEVRRGENTVSLDGTYQLDPPKGTPAPIAGNFKINVPRLADFGVGTKGQIVEGKVLGEGAVESKAGELEGRIQLAGSEFRFGEFAMSGLNTKIAVAKNVAQIEQLEVRIDETSGIVVGGKVGVAKPFAYEGTVDVVLPRLAVFQPLLAIFAVKDPISGGLEIGLQSSGSIEPQQHTGMVRVAADKVAYGKVGLDEVRLDALFTPESAETSALRIVMAKTSFEGSLAWQEGKLRLRDINLKQGEQQALSGFAFIPFEPFNKEAPIPFDKRLAVNVNVKELDIAALLASLGQEAPASGKLTANLTAGGTLLQPTAHVKVAGRSLKANAVAKLEPAELDIEAHYGGKELTLDLAVRQPKIQPLTVKGRVPLDLESTLQGKKLDPNLPLDVTVKLPSSSLAFVPTLVPQVRSIEGNAAIDARVSGTVQQPKLQGSTSVRIDFARLAEAGVPAIGQFQANIDFTEASAIFRTFRGELGGGGFNMGGRVDFPKITEPTFDLRLQGDDVLVMRDDSVTVRVDTDLRVNGPLAAGTATGTVWVTQSRFFRDIDILPIGLPGRPQAKPQPRSVPVAKTVSFDKPPLRDWKLNVAIKTRPDDRFQIRGNLANGHVAVDMRLAGTGLEPFLDGNVRIDDLVASLPFSKLEIQRGFVTFTEEAPFEPTLDIMAQSTLRDYRITAYVFGSATNPQISLTSEPPLPQEDIISLLATGATAGELTGSGDALASRAAVLLFQQLYRKIFKKNDPLENVPVLDRFDVEVGSVDQQTGRQEISASLQLGKDFYLIGDLDVAGQFTGRLRYLLRFK